MQPPSRCSFIGEFLGLNDSSWFQLSGFETLHLVEKGTREYQEAAPQKVTPSIYGQSASTARELACLLWACASARGGRACVYWKKLRAAGGGALRTSALLIETASNNLPPHTDWGLSGTFLRSGREPARFLDTFLLFGF